MDKIRKLEKLSQDSVNNKIRRLESLLKVLDGDEYPYLVMASYLIQKIWNKYSDNESLAEVDNAIEELVCCLENSIYELQEEKNIGG